MLSTIITIYCVVQGLMILLFPFRWKEAAGMFLKRLPEDNKKAKGKKIKSIEDDLYYLYGYSRKQISRMSESEKEDIWIEEEMAEEDGEW